MGIQPVLGLYEWSLLDYFVVVDFRIFDMHSQRPIIGKIALTDFTIGHGRLGLNYRTNFMVDDARPFSIDRSLRRWYGHMGGMRGSKMAVQLFSGFLIFTALAAG